MLNPVKNLMKDNELEGSVSVISDEITITGTVTSSGNLIINGNVDGEINCESLEIGPSGVVTWMAGWAMENWKLKVAPILHWN